MYVDILSVFDIEAVSSIPVGFCCTEQCFSGSFVLLHFVFIAEQLVGWIEHILLVCPSFCRYLVCFLLQAVVNNASVNIGVYVWCECVRMYFSGGHFEVELLTILRDCQTIF